MWKKGQRVLTAGNLIVKRDKRIALHKHHLVLSNLNIHDGGEYSCEIETDDPEPLAPRNGHVVVRKGTSVTIECRSNGNPTPVVSWTRKGNPLSQPLEETSNNGRTLTLHNDTSAEHPTESVKQLHNSFDSKSSVSSIPPSSSQQP
ncbi:Uncharacterized protein FKW44_011179 [Caligus rogercresseyi]|uniref:Ig-like domain-containing protein n=1 Tax=Caligus rogercresseyi TaxID=217165 RepID=A0A7T8K9J4_CALRO|nr:Uncharacterized protein FKW44_011179 [Caligus rogercresseyi]